MTVPAFPRLGRVSAITLALAAAAGLYGAVRAERTHAVDLALTLRIQGRRSRSLAWLMRAASWAGFPPQSRLIPPAVIAGWLVAGRPRSAAFQTAAWGSAVLSTGIKAVVRRPRPLPPEVRVAVAPLGGTSFPSGHVLTYTAFYGFLAYLVSANVRGPARNAVVWPLVALVVLVGPSRVQQGHHWPTDVTASYVLGVAYVLALAGLYERGGSTTPAGQPRARS